MKKKVMASITSILSIIALSGVGTHSIWYLYEPEIPNSLKE